MRASLGKRQLIHQGSVGGHMQQDQSVKPSRRTIVRAAAWTAPAVAMVAAAPAFATSGQATGTTPSALLVTRSGNEIRCTSTFTAGPLNCDSLQALVTVTLTGGNATLEPPLAAPGWTGPAVDGTSYTFTTASVTGLASQDLALRIPINTGNLGQVTISIRYTWAGNTTGVTTSGTYIK